MSLDDMLRYLDEKLHWIRPEDTGRSTNCLINEIGIYMHKKERGYHNYAFPYSWDVRIGHKERKAALEELNDDIDENNVKQVLKEIGYPNVDHKIAEQQQLVAYYTGDKNVSPRDLRKMLVQKLPSHMVPTQFIVIDKIPLTNNGKVDFDALPEPENNQALTTTEYVAPEDEFQEIIVEIWKEILQLDQVGIHDNFIELGGNSLAAIRIMARINEAFEVNLELDQFFERPTVAEFARFVEEIILALLNEEGEA